MPQVLRICKTKYAPTSFNGEGAFRFGGRWNTRGTARIIYTAGSLALAALEMLVHLDDDSLLLKYSFSKAQIPPGLILPVEKFRRLPKDWNLSPAPTITQSIGDEWARALVSAVLEVPSAIVPLEKNYLLNPAHADYSKITLSRPSKFAFDERLKSS
jgi:RES domain-containing protein